MYRTFTRHCAVLVIAVVACFAPVAGAQEYPNRPLRMIVPFPPGGSADTVGRLLAQEAAKGLAQPITIENRPGAGGNVGAEAVAKAPPDGYTILFGIGSVVTINPWLYKDMRFDPARDLVPVALISTGGYVLIVNPGAPYRSFTDFIAFARRHPGRINYASYGNGSANHLVMEMLKNAGRLFATHIPYRGAAPAMTDVIAGQVDGMFDVPINALPQIQSGKVRPIAVSTAKRMPQLPDVPAVAETFPGFNGIGWQGIFVPAGTPPAIVTRLNQEFVRAVRAPEVDRRLRDNALEPAALSVTEFAALVRAETEHWGRVVKTMGVKLD